MKPYHVAPSCDFYVGNVLDVAASLPPESVHVAVCSPPYVGLRDYQIPPSVWGGDSFCDHVWSQTTKTPVHQTNLGNNGTIDPDRHQRITTSQVVSGTCVKCSAWLGVLGGESVPDCLGWARGETCSECYLCHLRTVAKAVWRVLRRDSTFWVNIADSYGTGTTAKRSPGNRGIGENTQSAQDAMPRVGMRAKDRLAIPERLVLAFQSDGWFYRDHIHLIKMAPLPESVRDRTTQAHESLFMFSKSPRYYWDYFAVREPSKTWKGAAGTFSRKSSVRGQALVPGNTASHREDRTDRVPDGRNPRSWQVWKHEPNKLKHFAMFPTSIPRFSILAGSSAHGVCSSCGSPWERVVEKGVPAPNKSDRHPNRILAPHESGNVGHGEAGFRASNLSGAEQAAWRQDHPDVLVGWKPTCRCVDAGVVPATVWDPFSGSGTTSLVAKELGRRSLYTDISETYADMAIARWYDFLPLLHVDKGE